MSPEKARVFVAEDDQQYQEIIKQILEKEGHSVVLSATRLDEALEAVSKFAEMGIQVAIIDGNLEQGEYKGHDGQMILMEIKAIAPQVKTIGMSGLSVRGTDVDLGKRNVDKVGTTVSEL